MSIPNLSVVINWQDTSFKNLELKNWETDKGQSKWSTIVFNSTHFFVNILKDRDTNRSERISFEIDNQTKSPFGSNGMIHGKLKRLKEEEDWEYNFIVQKSGTIESLKNWKITVFDVDIEDANPLIQQQTYLVTNLLGQNVITVTYRNVKYYTNLFIKRH